MTVAGWHQQQQQPEDVPCGPASLCPFEAGWSPKGDYLVCLPSGALRVCVFVQY